MGVKSVVHSKIRGGSRIFVGGLGSCRRVAELTVAELMGHAHVQNIAFCKLGPTCY